MSYRYTRSYVSRMPRVEMTNVIVQPSAPSLSEVTINYNNNKNNNDNRGMIVCYLPKCPLDDGIVTCSLVRDSERLIFTTDDRSAMLNSGSIIDSIEFFGHDNFATKGCFSIGLGQFNCDISFPLIQDATSSIANEKVGGCRDFFTYNNDGKNMRNIVTVDSFVNVDLSAPVTNGGMQIVIYYHLKNL